MAAHQERTENAAVERRDRGAVDNAALEDRSPVLPAGDPRPEKAEVNVPMEFSREESVSVKAEVEGGSPYANEMAVPKKRPSKPSEVDILLEAKCRALVWFIWQSPLGRRTASQAVRLDANAYRELADRGLSRKDVERALNRLRLEGFIQLGAIQDFPVTRIAVSQSEIERYLNLEAGYRGAE